MQNKEVRDYLVQVVRQYGRTITEDPPKLQGLLKDMVGQHRREINVLMQALRASVPEELMRASGPTELTAERLASKLQEETGLSLDAAQWAVEAWGAAMGIEVIFSDAIPAEPDQPEPVAPAPVADVPSRPQTTIPTPPPQISSPPISNPIPSQPQYPQQQSWQQPPYQQQQFAPKKSSGGLIAILVAVVVIAGGAIAFVLMKGGTSTSNNGPTSSPTFTNGNHQVSSSNTPSPTASETASDSPPVSPTPSPSEGQSPGKVEGGVYSDGFGLFSYTPPPGWTSAEDDDKSGMIWRNSADPKAIATLDVREFENKGDLSLNVFKASMVANLKDKMNFVQKNDTDFNLAGKKGVMIYGSATDQIAVDCALIVVLEQKKVVLLSIETTAGTFQEGVKPIDEALKTWKWSP